MSDVFHAYQVPQVRQQPGFIICYGAQHAIAQPWNDPAAANVHFSVTNRTLCLLPKSRASAPFALILFSAGCPNDSTAPQRGKH